MEPACLLRRPNRFEVCLGRLSTCADASASNARAKSADANQLVLWQPARALEP
jgi:hypothetical protein